MSNGPQLLASSFQFSSPKHGRPSRPPGKQGVYSVPTSIGVWQRGREREIKRLETQEASVQISFNIQFLLTSL